MQRFQDAPLILGAAVFISLTSKEGVFYLADTPWNISNCTTD
jgi:hypothetical protein